MYDVHLGHIEPAWPRLPVGDGPRVGEVRPEHCLPKENTGGVGARTKRHCYPQPDLEGSTYCSLESDEGLKIKPWGGWWHEVTPPYLWQTGVYSE